ncbi:MULTISPECIES: ATP-binding protein [Psychrilyobacter]|uniref:histidine kinase n=1 Tax=Psychrilyobacter piezotolerans TaxID=2293438 RepID=A0ABX9KIA3_9FUSO|nr:MULTISPECIES: ATP-binding protein [Psychrilyobacter]MCS5421365.1 ATP-binding protein [Psychrilyobacter sp. S5]NDI77488.1 ATP-binding protein [Psychrilyobacter piezotolerans]RDE62997.1 ATP-binding protein [Psychrilyobacter sp. S5]REI41755.1 GHKL domain-containing protein [Psychrilyobacter piezotolerans]
MNKYFSYFILLLLTKNLRYYFFERELEFSGAVFTLFLLILIDQKINLKKIMGLFAGIFFIDIFVLNWVLFNYAFEKSYSMALPAVFYYYTFLLGCIIIDIKKYNHGKKMVILLIMDFVCNFLELLVKNSHHLPLINYMIIAIIIRGIIVYTIFLAYKKKEMLILQEEHNDKYMKLNLMASDLEAESFYLKKISANVEALMKKAYTSYKTVSDIEEAKKYFLDLSREIHELKKDYTRVVLGLDNLFNKFEHEEIISLSKIGDIIKNNTKRYLMEINLDILFKVKFKDNFKIRYYHKIFIVVNNLIINAIEAMAEDVTSLISNLKIEVVQYSDDDYIYIVVSDNGPGIPDGFFELICNPGFTTKFNKKTGIPSTGMGLSHVKNIVDEMEGDIDIISSNESGTRFEIKLPIKNFRGDTA